MQAALCRFSSEWWWWWWWTAAWCGDSARFCCCLLLPDAPAPFSQPKKNLRFHSHLLSALALGLSIFFWLPSASVHLTQHPSFSSFSISCILFYCCNENLARRINILHLFIHLLLDLGLKLDFMLLLLFWQVSSAASVLFLSIYYRVCSGAFAGCSFLACHMCMLAAITGTLMVGMEGRINPGKGTRACIIAHSTHIYDVLVSTLVHTVVYNRAGTDVCVLVKLWSYPWLERLTATVAASWTCPGAPTALHLLSAAAAALRATRGRVGWNWSFGICEDGQPGVRGNPPPFSEASVHLKAKLLGCDEMTCPVRCFLVGFRTPIPT